MNCSICKVNVIYQSLNLLMVDTQGDADVICGGPPCQDVSGYNRFRNTESPLSNEKNKHLILFMDIVEYLKPKFVLMENVDLVKFKLIRLI